MSDRTGRQEPMNEPTFEMMPVGDIIDDGTQPINQHLVELLGKTYAGERQPNIRRVSVQSLVARSEDSIPEDAALVRAGGDPLPIGSIPVVELSGGRFWAFDDGVAVAGWKTEHPDATIDVDVLTRYGSSAGAPKQKPNWRPNRRQ